MGLAQSLAELSPGSGIVYRGIIWVIMMAVSIIFVMMYARRVKKDPEKSVVYSLDKINRESLQNGAGEIKEFTRRDGAVLLVFGAGMAVMVWGVLARGWYTQEISMIFMMIGLFGGIAGGLREDEIADSFISGRKGLIYAALVIGLARAIVIVAQDGKIIDTILNAAANLLEECRRYICKSDDVCTECHSLFRSILLRPRGFDNTYYGAAVGPGRCIETEYYHSISVRNGNNQLYYAYQRSADGLPGNGQDSVGKVCEVCYAFDNSTLDYRNSSLTIGLQVFPA